MSEGFGILEDPLMDIDTPWPVDIDAYSMVGLEFSDAIILC
jgi:hypothetical protein